MQKKITKAVFPVAGLGTRFLPATKANPKEMLPIVDKPIIQYAVEEAIGIGVRQLIFVTSNSKRSIEDHFDSNFELETKLANAGKSELLEVVRAVLPHGIDCVYVRQSEQLGLGHAVLCAKAIVGEDPFAVILADDLISAETDSCLKEMANIYDRTGSNVLAVQEVERSQVSNYGVVGLKDGNSVDGEIKTIVEKPQIEQAPSNLAVVGRYILNSRVFHYLEQVKCGANGEIQLTDAIAALMSEQRVNICRFSGTRYDCGSKLGYLKATIEYALKHPEIGVQFRDYLSKRDR